MLLGESDARAEGDGAFIGTKRIWRLEEVEPRSITDSAHEVWARTSDLLSEVHSQFEFPSIPVEESSRHGHEGVSILSQTSLTSLGIEAATVIDKTDTFGHSPTSIGAGNEHCPIPMTHDRLDEAHYFLDRLRASAHEPERLRAYLNAFLQ
jgi:hypothetical protein